MATFEDMVGGYRRFRDTRWAAQRERWSRLAAGQAPKVMVIACSDSRVDPGQIFDADPGTMFVVRNVAALVPPFRPNGGTHGVPAALEFAVTQLRVEEVLVMGHGGCGGCAAALSGQFRSADPGEGGFLARWLELLDEARTTVRARHGDEVTPDATDAMEAAAVRVSLANLRSYPFVRDAEAAGQLTLHGAHFALADGVLRTLDEGTGRFAPA